MPVSNSPTTIRRSLDALLADKQMTSDEAKTLLSTIREGGISKASNNPLFEPTHARVDTRVRLDYR